MLPCSSKHATYSENAAWFQAMKLHEKTYALAVVFIA